MSVFFLTGCVACRAVVAACVGHLETDGVEHYLNVTEKREKRRKILLDAARPVLAYVACAGIAGDVEGPLFRPLRPDGSGFERRHLDRKTPWRLVKKYCHAADHIDPDRLGARRIGMYTLRKTAINDAIRNGASLHACGSSPDISPDMPTSARRNCISSGRKRTERSRHDGSRCV